MGSYAEEDIHANEIECPNCGEIVYAEALSCPNCELRFYVDEITEGTDDESSSQEKEISISAVIAAWFASAAIAFLINLLASRIWKTDTLNSTGQAVIFAAGPLGALAGGYLSARLSGKRVLLHGLIVSILSLVTAVLLETYWYDLFNQPLRPLTIASWAVLVLLGVTGAWIWQRLVTAAENPVQSPPGEQRLYLDLLSRVRHEIDTAERLIDFERRRNPSTSRKVWIQYAIERIEHDRR